jgi:hypothetical protein
MDVGSGVRSQESRSFRRHLEVGGFYLTQHGTAEAPPAELHPKSEIPKVKFQVTIQVFKKA